MVRDGSSEHLVQLTFRAGGTTLTVEDLAETVGLPRGSGLTIDGRRVPASMLVDETGLADGSILEPGAPEPDGGIDMGTAPWLLVVIGGPDAGLRRPIPSGLTTVGPAPAADLTLGDTGTEPEATVMVAFDGSTTIVSASGVTAATPGEPFRLGKRVLVVTHTPTPPVRPVVGTTVPVRVGPTPRAAPPPAPLAPADLTPPSNAPTFSWVGVLAPLAMGGLLAVLWSPRFALFAVLGPVIVVGTWWEQRRRHRRDTRRHEDDVARRTAEHDAALGAHRRDLAASARAALADRTVLVRRSRIGGPGLWDDPDPPVAMIGWRSAEPVAVPLAGRTVAIVGEPDPVDALARRIIVHLAVAHPPSALCISTGGGAGPDPNWSWIGWLPHHDAADPDGTGGHTITVHDRSLPSVRPPRSSAAQLLLLRPDDQIPPWTDTILEVGPDGEVRTAGGAETVAVAALTVAEAYDIARHLARWRDADAPAQDGAADTPLARLVGPLDDPGAVGRSWGASTLIAPVAVVGIDDDGPVTLDLVIDGPHAVIGGTTGSGKSELLRTLVASLCARHPPENVSFVLVDYKGGSAFDGCAGLPHVRTVVTDLDGTATHRVLAGIDAELSRRERWLRDVGQPDLAAAAAIDGRPPRLVVVIDEFATLAHEHPDALRSLVDIARRGRSLGLHLVLATQRPGGAMTDDIRANTDLRIALRMVDGADSVDVIGSTEAARLPSDRPGLAVIRRQGEGTRTMQVAVASTVAPVEADIEVHPLRSPGGRRASSVAPAGDDLPTQLDLLRQATTTIVATTAHAGAGPLWPPELPETLDPGDLEALAAPDGREAATVCIGLADDLAAMSHRPCRWMLDEGALALHGNHGADLVGVLGGVVATTTAQLSTSLHIYAVDGTRALGDWSGAHPVGAVAPADDRAAVDRLVTRLERTHEARSSKNDRCAGVRTMLVLNDHDAIVRALDDVAGLRLLDRIHRLIAEGAPMGVSTVVTSARPGSLPSAVAGAVSLRLVLRLAQADDYRLLGLRPPPSPLPPGRGLDEAGTTVQLVRVAASDFPERPEWSGEDCPPPLRDLPDSIDLAELDRPAESPSDTWTVPVGVGPEGIVSLELPPNRPTIIAGPPGSGRSTVLRTLAAGLADREVEVLVVACDAEAGPAVTGDADGLPPPTSPGSARRRIEDPSRLEAGGALVLIVDDATRVTDHDDLLAGLARGRLRPDRVRFVLALDPVEWRSGYGHWTAGIRRCRSGVALHPDPDEDRDLWQSVLQPAGHTELPPGRGVLLTSGQRPVDVQVARS